MIYRQRATIVDDLLLRVIFPWLTALHVTPILKLAHFWTVPVQTAKPGPQPGGPVEQVWGKISG